MAGGSSFGAALVVGLLVFFAVVVINLGVFSHTTGQPSARVQLAQELLADITSEAPN